MIEDDAIEKARKHYEETGDYTQLEKACCEKSKEDSEAWNFHRQIFLDDIKQNKTSLNLSEITIE